MRTAKELEPLDDDLREIVEQNMGLVCMIALPMTRSRLSKDDRIQAGTLGLIRAIQKFDPEIATFSTYASKWIRQAIQQAERKQEAIWVPLWARYDHADAELDKRAKKFSGDRDRAYGISVLHEDSTPARHVPETELERRDSAAFIRRCVDTLPAKEREAVIARFWGGSCVKEISVGAGVSRQAIDFRLERAARLLRRMIDPELAKGA